LPLRLAVAAADRVRRLVRARPGCPHPCAFRCNACAAFAARRNVSCHLHAPSTTPCVPC
jgi:hypothetical protein